MAISKTDFINYTRCPRYYALNAVHKEKLDADISYQKYKENEFTEQLEELVSSMYDEDDDLINVEDKQLKAMLPYYKKVEELAGIVVDKMFGGKTIYAESTFNQECADFSLNGILYKCYIDIYNESEENINIVEVKATTSKKFCDLSSKVNQEKVSIFYKENNVYKLKDEIPGYNIEIDDKSYNMQKEKLFDRYKCGKYVYDLAVQRYIIENEYKQSNNESKLKNINYYLAVLNHEYVYDGSRDEVGNNVYNTDLNGNEIITLLDMNKVTEFLQTKIDNDRKKLERYIKESDASPCDLGCYCEYKSKCPCKFFKPVCGTIIPLKNSSLSYINNGHGFKDEYGETVKGLELINRGFIDMMDIPESFIKNPNHFIQRDCYSFDKKYFDKEKIIAGLSALEYPIYHLDFETFPCPIPRFKGEWPYIQSPFEFSLHIEKEPGVCDKEKDNIVFLAPDMEDCREEMIKAMLDNMDPNKGTLFAQNVSFEKSRIKELAHIFPEYKNELMKLYDRGFDLLWLVNTSSKMYEELGFDKERAKKMNYYDKYLSGSFSIKKTLPVFSDLSYANLEVKNGTEAIVVYANYKNMSKEEFNIKFKGLIEYCKQDTWAMVVILDALRKLIK